MSSAMIGSTTGMAPSEVFGSREIAPDRKVTACLIPQLGFGAAFVGSINRNGQAAAVPAIAAAGNARC
jgi:hypothetical protein